jgi:hypothetical protein
MITDPQPCLYCQGGYVFGAKPNLITCIAYIFLSAARWRLCKCAVSRPRSCQLCVSGRLGRLEAEHGGLIGWVRYLKEDEVCPPLQHARGARGCCTASQRNSTKWASSNSSGKVVRAGEELSSVGGGVRPAASPGRMVTASRRCQQTGLLGPAER